MQKHLVGFGTIILGSALLGPLGLVLGIITWVLIAKS